MEFRRRPAETTSLGTRAVVLDEEDRVLLCRCALPGEVVCVAPGGGVEEGESMHRR
ncbi:NUDIX domain-containing protein [Streptomyces sp. NPDC018833]|uniref:NUDIX domain-containing protein n=1 Tax=Streptomyces sp. NPDC018833 TaxID=3365053 RepID=UPI00378BBEEB